MTTVTRQRSSPAHRPVWVKPLRPRSRSVANPPRKALDTPEQIATDVLRAFERRRFVIIPGRFRIRMLVYGMRFLPRRMNALIGEGIGRRYFLGKTENR